MTDQHLRSWKQTAFEQLVGDWGGDTADKRCPYGGIIVHQLHSPSFAGGRLLPPPGGELPAGGGLVFLDDALGHLLNDRIVLCPRLDAIDQQCDGDNGKRAEQFCLQNQSSFETPALRTSRSTLAADLNDQAAARA
jgi:hypothetical protein